MLVRYSITVPEEFMGEAMGKIVEIGGVLNSSDVDGKGRVSFTAEVPSSESIPLCEWLSSITNSGAKIDRVT